MQSTRCALWTKDIKCKKITPVEQITNKCTSCEHVFCYHHWSIHSTQCTAFHKKQQEAQSTLTQKLVVCAGKKVDEI
jgi:hypothetical protein